MSANAFSYILLVVAACTLSACNYSRLKNVGGTDDSAFGTLAPTEKATLMNYSYMARVIIGPKCLNCHGSVSASAINLESFENVFANRRMIEKSVFVDHSMPKFGVLSDGEKRLLWHWLQMNCPKDSPGDTSTPIPPPTPPAEIKATYDSINQNIFQNKCVSCHAPGMTAKRILLDRESLLNSPLVLV